MKPRKSKRERTTMKQPLVTRELPTRQSRHGKPIVMLADFDPKKFPPGEVGVRKSSTLKVAAGPTQKKGLRNGGVNKGVAPEWWSE